MQVDRPDYAGEIRNALTDVRTLCEQLGLLTDRGSFQRQTRGLIIRCPWHNEKTPSCSVRQARDGTIAAKCFSCGASGDALSLVAAAYGLNIKSDFRSVLRAAAELADLHAIVLELDTGERRPERPIVRAPVTEPAPERGYPPLAEVMELWDACMSVSGDHIVAEWIRSRGIDPERVDAEGLARALPTGARAPRWATFRRAPWMDTGHRLIVPMRNVYGAIVSVRGGRVIDGESPKRLPPGGHKASGIVMANEFGTAMLAGTFRPERVLLVEGEPDYLISATLSFGKPTAVIGIVNGSWTKELASRFPMKAMVAVWTDNDRAGDAYAKEITIGLRGRCFVRRAQKGEVIHPGLKAGAL